MIMASFFLFAFASSLLRLAPLLSWAVLWPSESEETDAEEELLGEVVVIHVQPGAPRTDSRLLPLLAGVRGIHRVSTTIFRLEQITSRPRTGYLAPLGISDRMRPSRRRIQPKTLYLTARAVASVCSLDRSRGPRTAPILYLAKGRCARRYRQHRVRSGMIERGMRLAPGSGELEAPPDCLSAPMSMLSFAIALDLGDLAQFFLWRND